MYNKYHQKGDMFIKYVEKNKDKSNNIKKLLNSIKTNKQFYQHLHLLEGISLSLKPNTK